MKHFQKLTLENSVTIYRWANEEVAEKGSIDWQALIRKTCLNIGATRKTAMKYIDIVKR